MYAILLELEETKDQNSSLNYLNIEEAVSHFLPSSKILASLKTDFSSGKSNFHEDSEALTFSGSKNPNKHPQSRKPASCKHSQENAKLPTKASSRNSINSASNSFISYCEKKTTDKRKARGLRQFGDIHICFLSFSDLEAQAKRQEEEEERREKQKNSKFIMTSEKTCLPSVSSEFDKSINICAGNPSVDLLRGILHFYKEKDPSNSKPSQTLCIFSVPEIFSYRDILQFLTPMQTSIEYIRVIRAENISSSYMLLIRMDSVESAQEFHKTLNGVQFTCFEDEICQVGFVTSIDTIPSSQNNNILSCSFIPSHFVELPACPVCLERLDEVISGVLTIACNHSFHSQCLYKWNDSRCPVCRYSQKTWKEKSPAELTGGDASLHDDSMDLRNVCFQEDCENHQNLWMCLICGNVGCSRYAGGHAYHHFLDTQHTYVLELDTQRVWDYAGDSYVHRLVQNSVDGKMIEISLQNPDQKASERNQNSNANFSFDFEKIDSIQLEFTHLLTHQLESQRKYFQEKMSLIEEKLLQRIHDLEISNQDTCDHLHEFKAQYSALEKEKKTLEKRNKELKEIYSKMLHELN
eukprot:Sdes_comp19395_c0_seq5m10705